MFRYFIALAAISAILLAALKIGLFDPDVVPSTVDYRLADEPEPVAKVESAPQVTAETFAAEISELPPSRWIEAEKKKARKRLGANTYDILIVPFQNGYFGFDAAARSLMTLSLAHRMATVSELRVADPILVEKAFGGGALPIDEADIADLSTTIGVRAVISGVVEHDRGTTFDLRIYATPIVNGEFARDSAETIAEFTDIPFDDARIPYYSFLQNRDTIVESIAGEVRKTVNDRLTAADMNVPDSFAALLSEAKESPIAAAHYLQFLGVLHPQFMSERSRELLFERSLVILENVGETSGDYRLLKARALTYLNRRPAALIALGKPTNPAEAALLDYLNGNLPRITENQASIDSALSRLVSDLERERMRLLYGGAADDEKLVEISASHGNWGPLLYQSFNDENAWKHFTHIPLKAALDLEYPDKKLSLDAYMSGNAVTGEIPDEHEIAQLTAQHLLAIEEKLNSGSFDPASALGPRDDDFVDLVRNMLAGNVYSRIKHVNGSVAKPASAVRMGQQYEPLFADHPDITFAMTQAYYALMEKLSEPEKMNVAQKAYDSGRRAFAWIGRMTQDTVMVVRARHWFFSGYQGLPSDTHEKIFYFSDWPLVPTSQSVGGDSERWKARLKQCLDYTLFDFECLSKHHQYVARDGSAAEAQDLLKGNENRFVGHPQRIAYFAKQVATDENRSTAGQLYEEAIEAGSTDWTPYEYVGTQLLLQSKFDEATKAFLRYPGFYDQKIANSVVISNNAYEVASRLFWAGAYEAARPMFEIVAGYQNGSDSAIGSAIRLALIDGDYEAAIQNTMHRIQRYNSRFGLRDLIGLASLVGDNDSAWAIVDSAQDKFDKPELWEGSLIAHRASGNSMADQIDWAFKDGRGDLSVGEISLPLRFVFLANTIDRRVSPSLADTLRRLDTRPRPRGLLDGGVAIFDDGRKRNSRHFPIRVTERDLHASNEIVELDPLLVMVAEALVAIEEKEYPRAYKILDDATTIYDIREFIPYYAWTAGKTGQITRIETYLRSSMEEKARLAKAQSKTQGILFDEYLAHAFLRGAQGQHADAIAYLNQANADGLHTQDRRVFTRFQVTQAAQYLYDDTGIEVYRAFALDLARRNSVVEPMQAWTHSFVAMLSDDPSERVIALARALSLDGESKCLSLADPEELQKARDLAANGYPMPGDEVMQKI